MKVEFLEPAETELIDAIAYYNSESEGLQDKPIPLWRYLSTSWRHDSRSGGNASSPRTAIIERSPPSWRPLNGQRNEALLSLIRIARACTHADEHPGRRAKVRG